MLLLDKKGKFVYPIFAFVILIAIGIGFYFVYPSLQKRNSIFNDSNYDSAFIKTIDKDGNEIAYKPKNEQIIIYDHFEDKIIFGLKPISGVNSKFQFNWQSKTKFICMYSEYTEDEAYLADYYDLFVKSKPSFSKDVLQKAKSGFGALTEFKSQAKKGNLIRVTLIKDPKTENYNSAAFVLLASESCSKQK